jgi:hypothetical protein
MEIQKVIEMIQQTPNDMELGRIIREYYWACEETR